MRNDAVSGQDAPDWTDATPSDAGSTDTPRADDAAPTARTVAHTTWSMAPDLHNYADVVTGSRLDGALSWYRGELALRRVIGVLALPGLAGLTGFGMLVAPGPVPWIMAGLTFLAAAEIVSMSWRLRRRPGPGDRTVSIPRR